MKVCTDACLFGAWLAQDVEILNAQRILDIGTGTGLLSLMVAQGIFGNNHKADTKITAVEIEANAAKEAKSNFDASPWIAYLNIANCSIQTFNSSNYAIDTKQILASPFNCIISNPPFFEGDLQSSNVDKNLALHSTALPWEELINEVDRLLKQDGYYYVLIPALRAYTMQKMATKKGIHLAEEVVIFNTEKQKPIRVFQKFEKTKTPITQIKRSHFIIKDANNNYTPEFTRLLKPFYLHL
jgi:tRNA1Val (adenine37-N6)-methyltransferase